MPAGIETTIDGDYAVVVFTDRNLLAAGVSKLLEHVDRPDQVQTVTHFAGRRGFRAPLAAVRAAGLLDEPASKPPRRSRKQTAG